MIKIYLLIKVDGFYVEAETGGWNDHSDGEWQLQWEYITMNDKHLDLYTL